ncbi:MAG: DNA polymerase IV [Acidobacteria bacterium]|nr:DNA polymerase IV [Acidobacteriota bacterium]
MDRNVIYFNVPVFPIAVERVVDLRLRGRPVVVALPGAERAVITAASGEALRAGIRKGMPVFRARKLCHDTIVLPPNPTLYERASHALINLLDRFSPVLEPAGFGHAYLEMTGTTRLFGTAKDAAARVADEVASRLRLPATVGVASNKLVSHVAADVIRTAGVQEVCPGDEASFLAPLPVRRLPGVGPVTLEQLLEFNIRQIRELAAVPLPQLVTVFGAEGVHLHERALGIDPTPVYPPTAAPALLEEEALGEDSNDCDLLSAHLFQLIERGARRLRSTHSSAGKIMLHIRYADYREAVQQSHLAPPTSHESRLFAAAQLLLMKVLTRRTRVRHLAVRFGDLGPDTEQLLLFPDLRDPVCGIQPALSRTIDRLRQRFGEHAIQWARVAFAGVKSPDAASACSPAPIREPFLTQTGAAAGFWCHAA